MKRLPKKVDLKIKNYGDVCHYCKVGLWKHNFSIDHVVPTSRKGSDTRKNKVACCTRCNALKASLTLEEFRPVFFYATGMWYFAFEPAWENQVIVPEDKRSVIRR